MFMHRADAPIFWERCEANATVILYPIGRKEFDAWKSEHPRSIISLYPASGENKTYLCDKHDEMIAEVI